MNEELRVLINNLTQDIIELFQITTPIINIEREINKLGGSIEVNCNIASISNGNIRKQGDSFVIIISPFQSSERKKLTIACEIGHLFLHMGYKINSELWNRQENAIYYRSKNIAFEYQANEFATALLMPKNKYREVIDKYTRNNIVDTKKVANYFGVSVSIASIRGKNLGYLQ